MDNDTIVSIATSSGNASIGVIRISGDNAQLIGEQISKSSLAPRQAHFRSIYKNNRTIDQGIIILFKNPHSFTGEDIVEIQAHGGDVVLNLLLEECISLGARQADAGEFSKRAFLNNKIDLAQAEAISDLISASSESAAISAINSLQGLFSERIHTLLNKTVALRVEIEASIDFPDEDIELIDNTTVKAMFLNIKNDIEQLETSINQGSIIQNGIKAVLLGEPNAGKSSLLNRLTQLESAIVTDIEGTTRDIIKEKILIDDLPVHIFDTAGIRKTDNIIESKGIDKTIDQIKRSDIVLLINDVSKNNTTDINKIISKFESFDASLLEHKKVILINNKSDRLNTIPSDECETSVYISAKNNIGIDILKDKIKKTVNYNTPSLESFENVFSARLRHKVALCEAKDSIYNAEDKLKTSNLIDLVAEDLRLAQNSLNKITGEFSADDLLGEIFSSFCIGK
jgi:tRNA modification GTPase